MSAFQSGIPIIAEAKGCAAVLYRAAFRASGENAVLRFAAQGMAAVWLNGKLLFTRQLKSFDFHQYYMENTIDPSMLREENILALECAGAFQLEAECGGKIVCRSGEDWKCLPNPARSDPTPGHSVTLSREEQYDATREPVGWREPDFDDNGWEYAAALPADAWKGYTLYEPDPLTCTPVYGKRLAAELLSISDTGTHFTLSPAYTDTGEKASGGEAAAYVSVLSCEAADSLCIRTPNGSARLFLDGKPLSFGESHPLAPGDHFLCLTAFGICEISVLTGKAALSARALCGEDAAFASLAFEGAEVRYPWHESCGDVASRFPRLEALCSFFDPTEAAREYRFTAVRDARRSSFFDVWLQRYAAPRGRSSPLSLFPEGSVPALPVDPPAKNALSLLDAGGVCEILPSSPYGASFVLDLGREYVGHVSLDLEAQEGEILDVQCFEAADGNGVYLMENYNGFRYRTRSGRQRWFSLSRYGCRYLLLTVRCGAPVRLYDVHLVHTAYPVSPAGEFRCSDERLNRIHEMCTVTTSLCMLDTYVDCPGHEQNFWVGDAAVTAKNNLLHFGARRLNQHCISFVGQSLSPAFVERYFGDDPRYLEGKFLSTGAYEAYPEGGLPMWSFLWVRQLWEHYLYGGSLSELRENYRYLTANLDNAERMIDSRGLFDMQGAWNLIEWGNNDLSPCGEVTANNVLLVSSLRIAALASEALGLSDRAACYRQKAEALCRSVNLLCWNEERGAYVDTVRDTYAYSRYCEFSRKSGQEPLSFHDFLGCERVSEQTNTLALLCGCVPQERRDRVLRIVRRPAEGFYRFGSPAARTPGKPVPGETRGNIVMVGSPFFLYFTLEALFDAGLTHEALAIIRRDWGKMLDRGTNTCWETFEMSEKKYTRSFCHAWSASPSIFLTERILGVRPVSPGWRTFRIEPQLGDLDWAGGSVSVPDGTIDVFVRRDPQGGEPIVRYRAPEGYVCENRPQ